MAEVYHLSDPHFGHKNIHKFRNKMGFLNEEDNSNYILERILSTISKRDKLFLHGDVCFSKESLVYVNKIIDYCPNTILILGNHDNESSTRPTLAELSKYFGNNIHSMVKYKNTWLTHAPIHKDELRGKYNIHGHTHEFNINDPCYYNVSCENIDYKPITHSKIMEYFNDMNGVK